MNELGHIGITIARRSVKHARLRVREDTSVELVVPSDFSAADIESVLRKKSDWIRYQQQFFAARPQTTMETKEEEFLLFGEIFRCVAKPELGKGVVVDKQMRMVYRGPGDASCGGWYRKFAREYLVRRTEELATKHGFQFGRIFVKAQRTRWGNCSAKLNISLNWHLIGAPTYASDYVILHELMHTRVMNHSQGFWVHLVAICPEHKEAIGWLQRHRPMLLRAQGKRMAEA
jgi:predicted metal-dependent hydrolase